MRIFTTIMFFIVSKVAWFLISPLSFIVLLLCIGLVALRFQRVERFGKWCVRGSICLLIICATLPIGHNLYVTLERYTVKQDISNLQSMDIGGIIVLGGCMDATRSSLYSMPQFNGSCERVIEGVKLYRAFPNKPFIYTGGTGAVATQAYKGADAAKSLVEQLGVDTSGMMFERQSRNTYENMMNSLEMIGDVPKKPWVLVTSSFHMPRSMNIFCHAGWPVIPYPTDFKTNGVYDFFKLKSPLSNIATLTESLKEAVGIITYGRTGKLSMNACKDLLK